MWKNTKKEGKKSRNESTLTHKGLTNQGAGGTRKKKERKKRNSGLLHKVGDRDVGAHTCVGVRVFFF